MVNMNVLTDKLLYFHIDIAFFCINFFGMNDRFNHTIARLVDVNILLHFLQFALNHGLCFIYATGI